MDLKFLNSELEKWKPAVHKTVLMFSAGFVWVGVGILLNYLSYSWLKNERFGVVALMSVTGLISAFLIHHFGFSRIVTKNLNRIISMEGKRCFFSFIPWKSYFLIGIMILTGSLIRHSAVPKAYLSILYIGIGAALILSGAGYFSALLHFKR